MLSLKYWNMDFNYNKMMRLTLKQAQKLQVGDTCYYVNTGDEIAGIIYEAKIKEIYKHHMELECYPLILTVEDFLWSDNIKPHIESIAFSDFCTNSAQALYKTLVLNDGSVFKMQH